MRSYGVIFTHKTTKLTCMWNDFREKIGVDRKYYSDPLLVQFVAQRLFQSLLKSELHIGLSATSPAQIPSITIDAIGYAAGYVLRSVRNKLIKKDSHSIKAMIAFINTLNVKDSDNREESYLEYTRRWIQNVNRGGLFLISDNVFETFCSLEVVQRSYLSDVNSMNCTVNIDELKQAMTEDGDVQFWWAMACLTLDNDLTEVLLKKIVKLWITIRGFAYASSVLNLYKECTKTTLQRKRSLNHIQYIESNLKSLVFHIIMWFYIRVSRKEMFCFTPHIHTMKELVKRSYKTLCFLQLLISF